MPSLKQLVISQADGTLPHRYDILENDKDELQWFEGSDSEDTARAGQPIVHKWSFFGGGACETVDMGKGGYFFSSNCTVCNPWRIRPRPETTSVTLTNNTVPVERFFEAEDSSSNKYLYCLAGAKSFKIKNLTATPALAETKAFAGATVFATGEYTGDGASPKTITGVGFLPALLIIKGDNADVGYIRTADVAGTNSKPFANSGFTANGITSLDADGFKVGSDLNTSAEKYHWSAWLAVAGLFKTGTYTGDGNDDRSIVGVGFKPTVLFTLCDTSAASDYPLLSTADTIAATGGGRVFPLGSDADWGLNAHQLYETDGFQVGSGQANQNGTTYYYAAFKPATSRIETGTYSGDGQDDRAITGVGFQPKYVIACTPSEYFVHYSDQMDSDDTAYFHAAVNVADRIQSLTSDGFTVGTEIECNPNNGNTVYYVAFGVPGTFAVGKPARWVDDLWIVPGGVSADCQELTTVHNETGGGDDTWRELYGLTARHFERRGNKLARATTRHVSLCAADDVMKLTNWGAEYAVGPPDTVINDLVEWKAELAIPTTDGMYMFDGVATSRQQLPLMGGIKDTDNGKNTLNWMGQVLVPTKGGLLRWEYGAAKPVGPDSIFGYVEAEGVANEPIHLQHFGLTYLEDWIYEAVYDGTNYHIIYYRPFGENFQVDFLLTSSSIIKTLFVDSNAILWYGLGNNLAGLQLSRSGAPTGGNYGEASLTGSFYTSEKVLADGANVRCRMAKVETDNNQTTLTWKLWAIRDGATPDQVGAAGGFKTDGEQKLYWAAASNLLARRLRYRLDFACSSFSPETTPPECLLFEFHGEALPDDADVIRAVVSLDSEGRANKTVYDELAAHENAGVRKVRSPITDETLTVTIFRRELEWVKQRGTEPPKVGVMLYMRRGDVA